jgi:iron complex transport system ATP-binding protein
MRARTAVPPRTRPGSRPEAGPAPVPTATGLAASGLAASGLAASGLAATGLAASGLAVGHGRRTVLADVDLQLRPGELVALVGPNGAGKSSLLHTLAGDLPPRAGSVRLLGAPLDALRPLDRARRLAVLPQAHRVAFGFAVEAVVRFGRSPWHGTPMAAEDDEVIAWAMGATAVAELAERPVTHLSGGEQARVALARVLAQRTPVLLLDEPGAALDPTHADGVLGLLASLAHQGRTVVCAVHDLTATARHADRIVLLGAGRVLADGPPLAVLTPDLLGLAYGAAFDVLHHPATGQPIVLPAGPIA